MLQRLTVRERVTINDYTMPTADGSADQVIKTDGAGSLVFGEAGGGDVVGPASATDEAVPRFDGVTGKIIQNSNVTISDVGNTVIPGTVKINDYTMPSADGVLNEYIKTDGAGNLSFDVPAGAGDVVGTTLSTSNQVVLFADGTGKAIKNSTVTIADTTGDTVIPGTLGVTGLTTLSGGLTETGIAQINTAGSSATTIGAAPTGAGVAATGGAVSIYSAKANAITIGAAENTTDDGSGAVSIQTDIDNTITLGKTGATGSGSLALNAGTDKIQLI